MSTIIGSSIYLYILEESHHKFNGAIHTADCMHYDTLTCTSSPTMEVKFEAEASTRARSLQGSEGDRTQGMKCSVSTERSERA